MSDKEFDIAELQNLNRLRHLLKDQSSQTISNIVAKLTVVLNETLEREKKASEQASLKQENISSFLKLMREKGLSLKDLEAPAAELRPRRTRAPFPPKYRYTDRDGNERTWTGQGQIPNAMKEAMARDGVSDKARYLIPREER